LKEKEERDFTSSHTRVTEAITQVKILKMDSFKPVIVDSKISSEDAKSKGKIECKKCRQVFSNMSYFRIHQKSKTPCYTRNEFDGRYHCDDCNSKFTKSVNLATHRKNFHPLKARLDEQEKKSHFIGGSVLFSPILGSEKREKKYGKICYPCQENVTTRKSKGKKRKSINKDKKTCGKKMRLFSESEMETSEESDSERSVNEKSGGENHCSHISYSKEEARRHRMKHKIENIHKEKDGLFGFKLTKSAHDRLIQNFTYLLPPNMTCLKSATTLLTLMLGRFLDAKLKELKCMKIAVCLTTSFVQLSGVHPEEENQCLEDNLIKKRIVVDTRAPTISNISLSSTIDKIVEDTFQFIEENVDKMTESGSGWVIEEISYLTVDLIEVPPLSGRCQLHPVVYDKKKGLSSCDHKNETILGFEDKLAGDESDERLKCCFHLALARHFVGVKGEKNPSLLKDFIKQNFLKSGVKNFPIQIKDIPFFEEAHKDTLGMSINVVYQDEENMIYPLLASSQIEKVGSKKLICLLLTYATNEEDKPEGHYSYLENPEKKLALRRRDSGGTHTDVTYICFNCFNRCYRKETYEKHVAWCHLRDGQIMEMPKPGEKIKFDKQSATFKLGFIICFDFESLQKTPSNGECSCSEEVKNETNRNISREELEDEALRSVLNSDGSTRKSPQKAKVCQHKTKIIAEHEPFAYSLLVTDRAGLVYKKKTYAGKNAALHFLRQLLALEEELSELLELECATPMIYSPNTEELFNQGKLSCHICHKIFEDIREIVRDHDHITGEFIGHAHSICNLHRKEAHKIPVFCHNFSGYDSHFLMQAVSQLKEEIEISAIPLNTQKFKVLYINNLVLLDSAAFLGASLSSLVDTLCVSDHDFNIIRQWNKLRIEATSEDKEEFLPICPKKLKKVQQKGIYPYSFATSIDKLKNQRTLPDKKEFFNILSNSNISDEEYLQAQEVYKMFNCSNMMDYTILYLETDTYLLSEVVNQLRDSIYDQYGLDLAHYISLPQLTKDLFLKSSGVEMELISDCDMINLIQSNIRGGLSFVNWRLAENPQETREKDTTKEDKESSSQQEQSILYLDANNLYGWR